MREAALQWDSLASLAATHGSHVSGTQQQPRPSGPGLGQHARTQRVERAERPGLLLRLLLGTHSWLDWRRLSVARARHRSSIN